MGKERVESKNLFNFKPQGHLDEDIEAFYEKGKAGLTNNSLAAWSDSMKKMSEEEFVGMMRGMMDKNIATSSMVTDPALVEVRWTSSAIIQSSLICIKKISFGHCPNYLPPPIRATCTTFLTSKTTF